jgi:TolA-binding protein
MLLQSGFRVTVIALLVGVFGLAATDSALARKGNKLRDGSPTTEDLANYFSQSRKGASIENLKRAEELRLQTIHSINQLLKSNIKKRRKFELYLRLGELHSERHDYLRDLEIKQYEKRYDVWEKRGRKGTEPSLSHQRSKAALLQSANSFRKLVREFPKHPRTDAALYALAKTLLRLENDNAVLYFRQLIRTHEKSPLIPDAYLALGEFYFYNHNMEKAKANYKAAMKYRNSKVYPYAVYKLGWAYFNSKAANQRQTTQNVNKAITAFKLVIKLAELDKRGNRNLNLRREAINDLIVVFAENERTQQALNYFRRIGEKASFYDMLERLGNTYVDNGQHKKAIRVFGRLLRESPDRKPNPEIHLKLTELYDKMGQLQNVVASLNMMNNLYVKRSSWTDANSGDAKRLDSAQELTKKNIHRFAAVYHKKGYKSKRRPKLVAASQLYQIYLKSFPKSEEAYELRYYLADIYFFFKRYDDAADEYLMVSRLKPKQGKYLKGAALNAVVAMKKIDEKQKYQKLPPLGQVSRPIPLPRVKAKMIKMMDNYVELLPKAKDGFPMRYTAAQIYFEYGHYKAALERFGKLGKDHPTTVQGKAAVKMILSYYSEKKQWDKLVEVSRGFLNDKAIASSSLKKNITKMLQHGMFQSALDHSKRGRHEASAKTFVQYQKEFPKSKDADDALYNATLEYYKVAKVEDAVTIGKRLLQAYPKTKYAKDVTLDIAQTNEALADFAEAAQYYRDFGMTFLKDRRARVSLYNAATLYRGLNKHNESIDLFRKYIRMYPKDKLTVDAHREIADQKDKIGDLRGAVVYYSRYAAKVGRNTEEGLFARARAGELMTKSGQRSRGKRQLASVRKQLLKKDSPAAYEARRIVARVMFRDLNDDFSRFEEMHVTNADRLERDVDRMQKRLLATVKKYEEIIEIGSGEFTVASLYRIGEMHEGFASELFDAPAPKGASQVEVDQYRSSIEKVAFPLKEESRKFFEAAYVRSKEVQTFTEWTRMIRNKMAQLDTDKYPEINEKNSKPQYMSHALLWEEPVASLVE